MLKQLTKNQIIALLNQEIADSVDSTHNNESHNLKGASITLEKVKKHLKDGLTYTVSITPKGYINKGELFELAYNHYRHNYITQKAPKNAKDTNNKAFTELKSLVNCHSTIDLTETEMATNKGLIILLNDACLYYLKMADIVANLKELKIYKGSYRLTNTFIRRYGKIKENNFQKKRQKAFFFGLKKFFIVMKKIFKNLENIFIFSTTNK